MSRKVDRKRVRFAAEAEARDAARRAARPPAAPPSDDPIEGRIAHAGRCARRGELRKATVLLREACALDEHRARSWTMLGSMLARAGKTHEAAHAFKQALYLRTRAGESRRARVTEALLVTVSYAAA